MAVDIYKLIWWFPIAFILHDFEELILFEPWLKKNAGLIRERIRNKIPTFIEKRLDTIFDKTTTQFALPIFLIFLLTCISSLLAAEYGKYTLFFMASSLFFLHGFMHIGQAILLRRYVPALITSVVVVIPYGLVLFQNLIASGMVTIPQLLLLSLISIVIMIPFILAMHVVGENIYTRIVDWLVG
jgi:hypothetical protein